MASLSGFLRGKCQQTVTEKYGGSWGLPVGCDPPSPSGPAPRGSWGSPDSNQDVTQHQGAFSGAGLPEGQP